MNVATLSPLQSYLAEANRTPLLSADDERTLSARILSGDVAARDHLVRANLRLVVNIARSYSGKGLPIEDLVSEGNMGLLRAVEGFDPKMNTRFSTYAAYWINQSIKRGIVNTSRPIRIPAYLTLALARWGRTAHRLTEDFGGPPTREEVAAELGLTARQAALVEEAAKTSRLQASGTAGPDDAADATGAIPDERTGPPEAALSAATDLGRLNQLMSRLGEREAAVLRMRFGLGGDEPMSLKEIGLRMGITRERVRQIEAETLKKLNENFDVPKASRKQV